MFYPFEIPSFLPRSSNILSPSFEPTSKPARPPTILRADWTITRLSLRMLPVKLVMKRREKLKYPLEEATMTRMTQRPTGAMTALLITVSRTPLAPTALSRHSASWVNSVPRSERWPLNHCRESTQRVFSFLTSRNLGLSGAKHEVQARQGRHTPTHNRQAAWVEILAVIIWVVTSAY